MHTGGYFHIGAERWKIWGGGAKMETDSVFPPLAEKTKKATEQPTGSAAAAAGQQTVGGKNANTSGPSANGAGASA